MNLHLATVGLLLLSAAAMAQDATQGKDEFRRCTACHAIGDGAANRMGPHLNGIVGEPAATREGFSYSEALMAKRDAGLVWTPQMLSEFLRDPRHFVLGTKMAFAGVKDETTLANIIAYVATFSPDWQPPAAAGTAPAAP